MGKICYVDEAGDLGMLPLNLRKKDNSQPVFVIASLFIDTDKLYGITQDFIHLKQRFFPALCPNTMKYLDRMLPEIKGADIRKAALRGVHQQRRHAIGFMDRIMDLFERYGIKIVARIWVKVPGKDFNGNGVYASSIQSIYEYFDHYLAMNQDVGFCIMDSRDQIKNIMVSHSIFTQKFRIVEPAYTNISELPCFSHSNNHVGLQLCDILSSAFLFPIAAFAYCSDFVQNVHVSVNAPYLRERYGHRLEKLQHRYKMADELYAGGLVVSDPVGKKSSALMFE